MFSELKELEGIKSRKSTDSAFKIIPVVSISEGTAALPDWLQGVEPLIYDANDPSRTISSLVKSLIPDIGTKPEETLDELLAEAERLVLRLKSIADQHRHSLILLAISFVVFASGGWMVIHGIQNGSGNPLSGFYQFFGIIILAVGGFFLFYSIVNWSSNYKRSLLSRRLLMEGSLIISECESFLKTIPVKAEDSFKQSEGRRYREEPGKL